MEPLRVGFSWIALSEDCLESAPNDDLAEKHQLTAPHVAAAARRALRRKNEHWSRRAWVGVPVEPPSG